MKAKGVRLHAANDLRLEEFELPEITDDEILVKVVLFMSGKFFLFWLP